MPEIDATGAEQIFDRLPHGGKSATTRAFGSRS